MKKLLKIAASATMILGLGSTLYTPPSQAITVDEAGRLFGVLSRYYEDLKRNTYYTCHP